MEWHLRKIDEELGKRVKLAALERGVSVQAFVVAAVEVALAGPAVSQLERSSARVEHRIVEQVAAVEPIARVRKVVTASQQPNYIDMKPSEVMRAMREAQWKRQHPDS